MKRNLITIAAVFAIITGGFIVAQGQPNSGNAPANTNAKSAPADPNANAPGLRIPLGGRFGGHPPFSFERFTDKLNLTPEQKAKVQPLFDQAKPQLQQIHEEAMQKARTVIEGTMSQVRAVLTPEQQAKFDEMKEAHENARRAMMPPHGNGDDSE